ncbi:hypothetical protein KPH14_004990 [Odynerus spinipes]|uniref:Uncharacterized protein n=1 Tax=Odynerus spinipes TaxID=1348599 RepID=A0AAD9RMZ1_9HYME|nr:hypothetical protein KPH14_004990 [Odynerus spinipes]
MFRVMHMVTNKFELTNAILIYIDQPDLFEFIYKFNSEKYVNRCNSMKRTYCSTSNEKTMILIYRMI